MGARLEEAGLAVERHPLAAGRDSLIARWPGADGGHSVQLLEAGAEGVFKIARRWCRL